MKQKQDEKSYEIENIRSPRFNPGLSGKVLDSLDSQHKKKHVIAKGITT